MPEDFRIRVSFRTSRKRRRLMRLLDAEGVVALVDLWGYCAAERPDGDLSGLTAEDIADEVAWMGDAAKLVDALVTAGFLDGGPSAYRLHGWERRQPWCATATTRSKGARKAAHERWASQGACHGGTEFCDHRCPEPTNNDSSDDAPRMRTHAPRNAGHASAKKGNAPTPTPTPDPTPDPAPTRRARARAHTRVEHSHGEGIGDSQGEGGDQGDPHGVSNTHAPDSAQNSPDASAMRNACERNADACGTHAAHDTPLDDLDDYAELRGAEVERALRSAGIELPLAAGARPLGRLLALAPILAWELRQALAVAEEHSPARPVAFIASVIRRLREQGATPPPRARGPNGAASVLAVRPDAAGRWPWEPDYADAGAS